ncbi:transcription factor grauzone-like [Bradysia coprophila]|uniref:transcription factor grauzone-like n=1 Tax=Bradysia coprophila TaxID=38358 RepID=UPI00187DC6DA|nr:transcription factor grauzone-like [Bradysia coprophila]
MDSHSQLCRLCLQNSDETVNIWKTYQDSTIAVILAKHFWFLQVHSNDGLTEWLCQVCWAQTKNFHEFYQKVEDFQKSYWDSTNNKNDSADIDDNVVADDAVNDVDPELTTEKTEFNLEAMESQVSQKDDSNYDCEQGSTMSNSKSNGKCKSVDQIPEIPNDEGKPVKQTPQVDDNGQIVFRLKGVSLRQTDEVINKTIREEQNRELNGQIREWFTLKCELCSAGNFDTFLAVKRHYRKEHQVVGYLKCCDKKLHSRCDLLDHIRYHILHPESPKENAEIYEWFTMKCDICNDVTFKTLMDVKRHYRGVHNVRGYLTCCNKKYNTRQQMVAHMRSHTNPNANHCKQCNRSFSTKQSLKNHVAHHAPLDSRAFKCSLCSSSFAREAILKAHVWNKHTSKNGQKFPCEKCNRSYQSSFSLKCHVRQCHETLHDYVCEVCARQFKSKHTLRNHFISEHSTKPQPRVQCDICGNWLKNEYNLNRHVKEKHTDNEPAKCDICNKVYSGKVRLRKHIRYVHGEKNHRCTLCEKPFNSPFALKEHVATHTGEDLYKCQHCEKKWKSSGNLSSHMKKAHYAEWSRNLRERNNC